MSSRSKSNKKVYKRSRYGQMSPVIMAKTKPLKKGSLSKVGYKIKSPVSSRRSALRKASRKYGKGSTIRKLNLQATYRKRSDPKTYRSIKSDVKYVQSLKD